MWITSTGLAKQQEGLCECITCQRGYPQSMPRTQRRVNTSRVTGCKLMCSIGIHSQEMLFKRRSGRSRRLQVSSGLPLPMAAIRLSVTFRRSFIFSTRYGMVSVTAIIIKHLTNRFNCTKVLHCFRMPGQGALPAARISANTLKQGVKISIPVNTIQ